MKPKLLIFTANQFGYHTDSYKYCEYARLEFSVTYIGWDYSRPRISITDVSVKYISREGNLIKRNLRLLSALNREIQSGNYDAVFMQYTKGISVIRLLNPNQTMVFDVRTLSVAKDRISRSFFNLCLKAESLFFKNHSVISRGVAAKLRIKDYFLLPLGADAFCNVKYRQTNKDVVRLLYVGTLNNRDVYKCVVGLEKYIGRTGDNSVSLTIIGDSPGNELDQINEYIKKKPSLCDKVRCLGRVPYDELNRHFAKADVGVSFIPITPWYDCQPPTKTYEYLLANLPIIATRTQENIKTLENEDHSVLINDTSDDFADAIPQIKAVIKDFQPVDVSTRYRQYTWEYIVKTTFIPMIGKLE